MASRQELLNKTCELEHLKFDDKHYNKSSESDVKLDDKCYNTHIESNVRIGQLSDSKNLTPRKLGRNRKDLIPNKSEDEHMGKLQKIKKKTVKICKSLPFNKTEQPTHISTIKQKFHITNGIPIPSKNHKITEAPNEDESKHMDKFPKYKRTRETYFPRSPPIWTIPKKQNSSDKRKPRRVVTHKKLNTFTKPYPIAHRPLKPQMPFDTG